HQRGRCHTARVSRLLPQAYRDPGLDRFCCGTRAGSVRFAAQSRKTLGKEVAGALRIPMISKLALTLRMIKIEHSVFALPFALISAMVAAGGLPSWDKLLWILIAMV